VLKSNYYTLRQYTTTRGNSIPTRYGFTDAQPQQSSAGRDYYAKEMRPII
jgi:hypothetical protein